MTSAALPFKDLLFHSLIGWAPRGWESRAWMPNTWPIAIAIVVVIYIADFVGDAVAVLVDVVTPAWSLRLRDFYALKTVGAAVAGEVEVTILVIEAGETSAHITVAGPTVPTTQ